MVVIAHRPSVMLLAWAILADALVLEVVAIKNGVIETRLVTMGAVFVTAAVAVRSIVIHSLPARVVDVIA